MSLLRETMTNVALSARNKTGLVLAFLLGLINMPMFLRGAPDPGEIGPPLAVLITESVCGLVTVGAVAIAWRTASPWAIRLAAGSQIVSVLTALPALFVDRPALNKLLLALVLGVTLTAVILMLTPSRRDGTVDQPAPWQP